MRRTHCTNPRCKRQTRTNDKFKPGKCPHCKNGEKAVSIKGKGDLLLKIPDTKFVTTNGHSTIPRRYRPVKADGSPKSRFP